MTSLLMSFLKKEFVTARFAAAHIFRSVMPSAFPIPGPYPLFKTVKDTNS